MSVTDSLKPRILKLASGSSALVTWLSDPRNLGAGPSKLTINGNALDDQTMYVSKVDAVRYLVRIRLDRRRAAGHVDRIQFPRLLNRVDGLRVIAPHTLLFSENDTLHLAKNKSGVALSTVAPASATATATTLASGMLGASSCAVFNHRVYYTESKFAIILRYTPTQVREGNLKTGMQFAVRSVELPK